MADAKEGWNYLVNSPKWHYFLADGHSICKRYLIFGQNLDSQTGNDNSPDNCKACKTALEKRKAKAAKA